MASRSIRQTDVTVVVPTKNEATNIMGFLAGLPPTIQLVVVDAGLDETVSLIESRRPTNTRIVRHPGNVAVARNVGAALVETEWMLCTDADVVFPPEYWLALAGLRVAPEDAAVVGTKVADDAHAGYYRWFTRGQALLSAIGIPAATGSNLLVRMAAFRMCAGFDTSLAVNEDSELAFRIRRAGNRIRFQPDLAVRAVDHRRIDRGAWRKTAHSVARNGLLLTGTMPMRWRTSDWGYWQ